MRAKRHVLIGGLVLLGLALAYGLVLCCLIVRGPTPEMEEWFRPRPREPFSTAAWQASRFGDPARFKMANDLVRSGRLRGMTQEQLETLLGKETSRDELGSRVLVGYDLVPQKQFPAKCIILPRFLFWNTDTWLLEVEIGGGHVEQVRIRGT
jgi:hypothetical protein